MFQIKIEWLTTLIFHSKRVYKNATKKLSKLENKVEQRNGKLLKKKVHMTPFHFLTLLSCLVFGIKATVFNQLATSKQTRVF